MSDHNKPTKEKTMTKTYETDIHGVNIQPPAIGTQCWIVEKMFGDHAAETIHSYKCPETNQGHQREAGWLGSWNEESKYARGKCWLVETQEVHSYPNPVSYYDHQTQTHCMDDGDPVVVGYTLIWSDEAPSEKAAEGAA
jgi:hypothetical protein